MLSVKQLNEYLQAANPANPTVLKAVPIATENSQGLSVYWVFMDTQSDELTQAFRKRYPSLTEDYNNSVSVLTTETTVTACVRYHLD